MPGAGEYLVLEADLHMHTVFSDGQLWPVTRGMEACQRFQPENGAGTQILANVWDKWRPQTPMPSSKTGWREVTEFGCGSPRMLI